jgi:glyoxylate/hydroxypyruvate reductase A
LPAASPFWTHPKVTITPHTAGDISPQIFAPRVIEQIERYESGLPLDNLIDRSRGY